MTPIKKTHKISNKKRNYLKTYSGFQGAKIIAQTAHALKLDKEKALQAGCNDYISKPFEINKLITVVAKHLSQTIKK